MGQNTSGVIARTDGVQHSQDSRFVEQEVHRVVLDGTGVRAQSRERDDELVARIHFQDRLRGISSLARRVILAWLNKADKQSKAAA
jgi:hypothetical protein